MFILDFLGDWTRIMRDQLRLLGYTVEDSEPFDLVCHRYFNVARRRVPARPRRVHRSQEFSCPPEHATAIGVIERKAAMGSDLTPHVSKLLLDSGYADSLVNDWGILHFHLGLVLDQNEFVTRTGPLLFARFTNDDFYMINVKDHSAFADQELLEILHSNWPGTLSRYRSNAQGLEASLTSAERRKLRKARVVAPVQLSDETIYLPMGDGYMTSGLSTHVALTCDSYHQRLEKFEDIVRNCEEQLRAEAWRVGAPLPENASFRLEVEGNKASAQEPSTGLKVKLGLLAVRRAD